jgi:hypothetical protein
MYETLKQKEKQEEEYMRIMKQELEENNTKMLANQLISPQPIYTRNKSRKNKKYF